MACASVFDSGNLSPGVIQTEQTRPEMVRGSGVACLVVGCLYVVIVDQVLELHSCNGAELVSSS
jgi:hypothetical protein